MKPFARVLLFSVLTNIFHNMVHPVTPTFLTGLRLPDYTFGVLYAAMAVGMLVMSPVWGKLSDKRGRRPVLALGNLLYGGGQALFFCAKTIPSLVLARAIAGIGSSGALVALLACAVDLTDDANRASRLSTYAAAATVSTSLGYFLGGMVGTLSVAHAFISQVILMALVALAGWFFMPETYHPGTAARAEKQRFSLRKALSVMTVPLFLFLVCVVLANLGTCGYDNSFNYYLTRELGFPSSYNGIIKAVTGLLGLLATLGLNRVLIKRFEVDRALKWVLAACAISLGASMLMKTVPSFIALSMLFCLFNAMYPPLQQSLITRASACDFGLLSGLFNSARSLGMVAGALAAGFLYTASPLAPFAMEAICFALAAVMTVVFSRHILPARR